MNGARARGSVWPRGKRELEGQLALWAEAKDPLREKGGGEGTWRYFWNCAGLICDHVGHWFSWCCLLGFLL